MPVDPAGGRKNPRTRIGSLKAHLRVSHTSLDGLSPPTIPAGPATAIIRINSRTMRHRITVSI